MINEISPEVQQQIDQTLPVQPASTDILIGGADSGHPNLPVQIPLANPRVDNSAAPNIQSNPPDGTFANKLSGALTQTAENPASKLVVAQPGGFSKLMISSVLDALSNQVAGLGDAAHATDNLKSGQGWLSGALNTLNAQNVRQSAQRQQNFENDLRSKEFSLKQQADQQLIAKAQVDTLLAQQTLRHADATAKREAFSADQAMSADLDSVQTPKIATGLNSDALTEFYRQHPNDRQNFTVLVDKLQPETDKDGQEFLRPLFSVYGAAPSVTLNKTSADFLSKYDPSGQTFSEGLQLPGASYISMMKRAKLAQAQDLQSQKLISDIYKNQAEGTKAAESALDDRTRRQYGIDIAPEMQHVGGNPIKALDELKKSNDPAAVDLSRKIVGYYGPEVIARLTEAAYKEANENMRHAQDMKQRTLDSRQTAGLNFILKDSEKFQDTAKQADAARANIAAAKTGDALASSMTPLMTALGVSTFAGVHRINQTEVENAGPQVGSLYRRLNNILDKAGKGTLSPDSLQEANDIFDRLSNVAYEHYVSQQLLTAAQRQLDDDTLIYAPNGRDLVTLGEAKQRRAAQDQQREQQGQPKPIPQGAVVAQGSNGHQIYTTDNGKTWIDSTSGLPLQTGGKK